MKVGIDVSALHFMSKGRGIGFYTEYLIEALKRYTDLDVVTIESVENKPSVDLIHYPFFDFFKPTLKIMHNVPTVVTIHDVIPLLFPKAYPPGLKGRINLFRQKQALKKVKAVITDSESSTLDALKVLPLSKNKVFTVYLAQAEQFKKMPEKEALPIIKKFNLSEKFVLYTGGVNWNKNLLNQTEAAISSGIDIVLVGGGFETKADLDHPELKSFKEFLAKYKDHPQVHILGFVSSEEIVALMSMAFALLTVSYYEGFGLPVLEGQSCGAPIITANNSSLSEVVGDGGIKVDPSDQQQITNAINRLSDQQLKSELIKKGFENLKRFSWEKTAKETVKVYEYALSQR